MQRAELLRHPAARDAGGLGDLGLGRERVDAGVEAEQQPGQRPPGLGSRAACVRDEQPGRRDRIGERGGAGLCCRALCGAAAGDGSAEAVPPLARPCLHLAARRGGHAGQVVQPDRVDRDKVTDGRDGKGLDRRQGTRGQAGLRQRRG